MAKKLTGMEIFKLLPKTNCGECGVPTCMAFAMKLAQKTAELSSCPYASDSAKEIIGAAAEPPIRLVKLGDSNRTFETGNELVMFRHEKTFVHQTVFSLQLSSKLSEKEIIDASSGAESYCLERVGEKLRIDSLLINDESGSTEEFIKSVTTATTHFKGLIIIKSSLTERIMAAAEKIVDRKPLLHALTSQNFDKLGDFVCKNKLPVVISDGSLDNLSEISEKLAAKGHRDIILEIPASNSASLIQNNTIIRKSALSGVKQMGYPIINFLTGRDNGLDMIADAASSICKYASIIVIDKLENEVLLPLMILRQNIFTDPQKPIQVEPGIYNIGEVTNSSPVMVTTNFSLTYFIVSGEVESSGVPVSLALIETEGMSVLTAWAAGKFSGEKIASFLKSKNIESLTTSRKLIIPGYVACISGELEEQLPGWEILVGPQDASDIGPFMKRLAAA